ncbi:hypothetical protein EV121DRAFT_274636 [Schizophyllum commune]
MIVVPAGQKSKIDVKCAEVRAGALADRCDAGPWWVGGDETRERSGAERRRASPRPASSLIAATVERAMGAARSAAEGADTARAIFCALSKAKKYEIGAKCAKLCLKPRLALQELTLDLQRPSQDRSGSEATYQRPASEDLTDIAIPPAFSLPLAASRTPFVPPLGDEYTYRRPPSEDPYSSPLLPPFATLSSSPRLPPPPPFSSPPNFNTPRGLGADAHHNETAFNITELV